jgi:hypothetical protein
MARPEHAERAQRESQVSQGDVVELPQHEEVHDDAAEPETDDNPADLRLHGDDNPSDDFDDADADHEGARLQPRQSWNLRSEVFMPRREQVKELVGARNDRRRDKPNVEQEVGMVRRLIGPWQLRRSFRADTRPCARTGRAVMTLVPKRGNS